MIVASRREFLALASAALGAASAPLAHDAPSEAFQVCGLRVDGLETPLGLESIAPRLSWQLTSKKRGFMQRQFRVEVASDPQRLRSGVADVWDSGWVNGDQTFDVVYQGPRPMSRQRLWWRVEASDAEGRHESSAISWWEMGLLDPTDWLAHWSPRKHQAGAMIAQWGFVGFGAQMPPLPMPRKLFDSSFRVQ